jgi:predicted AlkP superfamily pyrophosphatase or phosphodiesterase
MLALAGARTLLLATLLAAGPAPAAPPAPALERVVVISVDGLMPASYLEPDKHGLKVPMLREMARGGAVAAGARSVFPSVTYPAHTTVATGVEPATHGIVTNTAWDPGERNQEGWWWYAEDIKARTLWDAAAAAGLKAALVNWPVTVGANAAWLVPEYWRAGTPDDRKLTRALSTPGLLEAVAAHHPGFWDRFTPPNVSDDATIDVVVHLLEAARPSLVLAHIWQTDDAQHKHGPWSAEARASIENADRQLARVVQAARAAPGWSRTAIVVVSDHGFTSAARQVRPGALLRERGLVALDDDGHPRDWKTAVTVAGGLAFFYLADPADQAAAATLGALLRDLGQKPGSGFGRLYDAADIRARGGDPRATFAVEAAPGFCFLRGYQGDAYPPPKPLGQHGYDPERPDMQASLIFFGGAVRPRRLEHARLVDVAPTIAKGLGLDLPAAAGRPLPVLGRE